MRTVSAWAPGPHASTRSQATRPHAPVLTPTAELPADHRVLARCLRRNQPTSSGLGMAAPGTQLPSAGTNDLRHLLHPYRPDRRQIPYYYQGRAVDSRRHRRAHGLPRSTPPSSQSPNISAPTRHSARPQPATSMMTLSWSAPSSLAGLTIATGYDYRQQESAAALGATGPMPAMFGTVDHVQALPTATTYNFELRAVSYNAMAPNGATASHDQGNPRQGVPDMPGALTAAQPLPSYQRIILSWTAPASNGGAAVTSLSDTSARTTMAPAAIAPTTVDQRFRRCHHRDHLPASARATEYTFTACFAINVAGDSDWTSASAITLDQTRSRQARPTDAACPLPQRPGIRSRSQLDRRPSSDGGAAVTGYRELPL